MLFDSIDTFVILPPLPPYAEAIADSSGRIYFDAPSLPPRKLLEVIARARPDERFPVVAGRPWFPASTMRAHIPAALHRAFDELVEVRRRQAAEVLPERPPQPPRVVH